MKINIGDRVNVLDEELSGIVVGFEAEQVIIQCSDGFEYQYALNQILRINDEGQSTHFVNQQWDDLLAENDSHRISSGSSIQFKGSKPEIDLHMEELIPEGRLSSKSSALEYQLNHCRAVIQKATQARLRNLVFVHGMGSGTLRDALRKMLSEEYPQIEYFDGNYQRFGHGATEIIIHGLGKLRKT